MTPRWDATLWEQALRFLLFTAVMALVFTVVGFIAFASGDGAWRNLAGWRDWYVGNFGVALCIGVCIKVLYTAGYRIVGIARIRRFNRWQRIAFWGGLPMLGVVIGSTLSQTLIGVGPISFTTTDDNKSFGFLLFSLLLFVTIYQFYAVTHRRIDAERRATEAQLRLLQGQMEPHFLFNTLANVLGLMDADTPRAKVMLEAFVEYLRSSLGSLRGGDHTLGDELALVDAYLRVQSIRMDTRLAYRIDVPEALHALALPPLTLQPLVENAVVHGLEPGIDGGTVTISARSDGGLLRLCVEDDGIGLPDDDTSSAMTPPRRSDPSAGTGTALANIAERLRHAHGEAATLRVEPAPTRGVRATLQLPLASLLASTVTTPASTP